MKKKQTRYKIQDTRNKTGLENLFLGYWNLNQLGIAPIIFLALSGIMLATMLVLIAFDSFNVKNSLIKSSPKPNEVTIGGVAVASPIPVDPNDPALCDDEYNADCDNLEGDDIDPADLAGPD